MSTELTRLQKIQVELGQEPDDIWGPRCREALALEIAASERRRGIEALEVKAAPQGTGTSRTDWRGFVDVPAGKLKEVLPSQAHQLIPSFLAHAKEFGLHPLFLIAISKHETGNWTSKVFQTKNNAMGISDKHGAIAMPSYDESIRKMAAGLASPTGYYKRCKTLADIAKVYAPVGAANDPGELNAYWPKSVAKFWAEFEQQVGAPTATVPTDVVPVPSSDTDKVDERSERAIATLLPVVKPLARQLIRNLTAAGINAKIISGSRTYADQNALYEQGRSKPGPRVTNARGGYSWHNFGVALDIGIFADGKYLGESPLYAKAGEIGKAIGFEWGGDWKGSLVDEPHFQYNPGKVSLVEARALRDQGKDIV
jgi:peptidoglycan LD-endopeptidase CwlK